MNITRLPGIYIHIPFCQAKCGYCDFYSIEDNSLTSSFIDALIQEIKLTATHLPVDTNFDTIYIGGGTPSLLPSESLYKIINVLSNYFTFDKDCEITIEVNPGTVNLPKFKQFSGLGINRVSLGIQSFIDEELQILERIHSVTDAEKAIEDSKKAGFENINLDLIFALPNQSLKNWSYTLNKSLSFNPEHLSIYNLTFEPGTPFFSKLQNGQFVHFDDECEGEFFNLAHLMLGKAQYLHYEVSNYAKSEDCVSRHNYKYWYHAPYFGFGPSAHSLWDNNRWSNVASVTEYIAQLNQNNLPRSMNEKLKNSQLIFEHIFLALRTYRGLHLYNFKNRFGIEFLSAYGAETVNLIDQQLAVIENDYFKLTEKGMLVCDEILPAFATD